MQAKKVWEWLFKHFKHYVSWGNCSETSDHLIHQQTCRNSCLKHVCSEPFPQLAVSVVCPTITLMDWFFHRSMTSMSGRPTSLLSHVARRNHCHMNKYHWTSLAAESKPQSSITDQIISQRSCVAQETHRRCQIKLRREQKNLGRVSQRNHWCKVWRARQRLKDEFSL